MAVEEKKKKKVIKVDVDKCNGCRACETICSAFHAEPKYSSTNPEKSKIRVLFDPIRDVYVPVYAGEYTEAECNGRGEYTIDEKTYDECAFCRASCPARDYFKDPDSGLPLKCDMCLDDPPQDEPLCVKWCLADALTYEEVDEDGAAHYVTEGVLRASHRRLAEAPWGDNIGLPFQRSFREDREPLPAGKPTELVMDLFPTSTVFNAGHRIRVTIMGADADNLELPEVVPIYHVYRSDAHPSSIVLPVVR